MPYAALDAACHVLHDPGHADLERAAGEIATPGLMIFGYAFESFHPLSRFGALHVLKIQGAPRLSTLDGAEELPALRELVLSTTPGSDGSGRRIEVRSLAPLERMPRLERLILLGVRPSDLDLSPVMRMQRLREWRSAACPSSP